MRQPEIVTRSLALPPSCWTARHHCFLARRKQILMIAERVLGDESEAELWFVKPARGLDYQSPCKLLSTRLGFLDVDTWLWRIEHGVYI
jgi:uncharacterized protein (DUF2384 family)